MRLSERVQALEKASAPAQVLTIIRRFVSPGQLDAELNSIEDDKGGEWTRNASETEAEFIARAESETPANQWGIRQLIGKSAGAGNV